MPCLLAFSHCLDLSETRDVLLGMLPEDMILTAFSFLLGVGNSQGLPSLGLGELGEWAQEVSFDVICRSLPPASPFPSLSVYLHLQRSGESSAWSPPSHETVTEALLGMWGILPPFRLFLDYPRIYQRPKVRKSPGFGILNFWE